MSKLLDALFVFQLLLLLGALLLIGGVVAIVYGALSDQLDVAVLGILSLGAGLSNFVVAHIGRTLLHISASNAAILERLGKA